MGELEQYLVPIRQYSANPCMDCCCPISQCPWLREGNPCRVGRPRNGRLLLGEINTA